MTSTQDCPAAATTATGSISNERRAMLSQLGLMLEADVCLLCNVQSETLLSWRREGRGPSYAKMGRQIVYRIADIKAWIESTVVSHVQAAVGISIPQPANDAAAAAA